MPVEFILGPMCSGKSDLAIEKALHLSKEYEIIALKSVEDARDEDIQSRTGASYPCKKIHNADLLSYLPQACQPDVAVLIDEGWMFREHLVRFVKAHAQNSKSPLIVSTLDRCSEGEWWGCVKESLPYAHIATFLRARCDTEGCHYPATQTWYTGVKKGRIQTGNAGYSPRCKFCWDRLFHERGERQRVEKLREYYDALEYSVLEEEFLDLTKVFGKVSSQLSFREHPSSAFAEWGLDKSAYDMIAKMETIAHGVHGFEKSDRQEALKELRIEFLQEA